MEEATCITAYQLMQARKYNNFRDHISPFQAHTTPCISSMKPSSGYPPLDVAVVKTHSTHSHDAPSQR